MPQPDVTSTHPHERPSDSDSWGQAPAHTDLTGRTLGDYQIERLLGRGGMGEVYLARQISLDRLVAFKVLRPDLLTNATTISRFEAEAGAAAKINHANIVHIYNVGMIDGLRYIAMEYVAGTTLREYIQRKGGLELAPALSIMRQAAQAVGAAGEIGLVHRDIKPENLLLNRKGQVKVADFGLCRVLGPEQVKLTQQGVALGTPLYMSPEQVQGREVDHRSDLYSLGVTFYYMLSGQAPFEGDNPITLALKHVHEPAPSLSAVRPDLPADLVALVQKLMAKNPTQRYPSAAELLKDLSRIRAATLGNTTTQTIASEALSIEPALGSSVAGEQTEPARAGADAPRLPRIAWWQVAAVLVLSLIGGAALGWRGRPENLLAAGAPEPSGPPCLWLAPGWTEIPRKNTPEEQYRYAQLQATANDRQAAWLAVPGNFPGDRKWTFPAYVQLARKLYHAHDVSRLRALAEAMAKSENARDQELGRVAHAATAALRDDDEFLGEFSLINPSAMDGAVAELALEIVTRRRQEVADGPTARRLAKLRSELLAALQVDLPEAAGPARSR